MIIVIAWSSQILEQTSQVLINPGELFPTWLALSIFIGILLVIESFLIIFVIHRKYSDFFKGKEVEEFEKVESPKD